MAEMLFQSHINLDGNELQNAVVQNLSTAPASPKAGQFYYNTADNTLYVYNGTAWVDALSQGDYKFQNGLEEIAGRAVQLKIAAGPNAGNVVFTANENGLAGSVDLSGKVDKLGVAPSAGTYTKVTINADGLVTEGASLVASDIPDLTLAKITDVTASAEELNIMDGVTVTTEDINSIPNKIELTDLSVASGSANYLTYNNATGEFGAKVDTTVTAASTNLVTSGAVESAISAALVGGVIYKGTWNATGQDDYSGIALPVKQGYLYLVQGSATIDGIEWNAGDYLMVNEDVEAGGTLADVSKIDNTEAADIVRLNATQTLTNKTISATNNTISDLATGNFASGVIVTEVGVAGSDLAIPTEQAVREALTDAVTGMVTLDGTQTLTNKTVDADDNTISNLETDNFKAGVIQTAVRASSEASDTALASEKAVALAVEALPHKLTATNGELTAAGGVCTWTVANTLATADVNVFVYRVADGVQVMTEVDVAADNIVAKFNSTADIAAGTYKIVVFG